MKSESFTTRAGKVLYKGRWFWLIGVISLFILNFLVLYNVQRAVQETQQAENRLKEKSQKIDIMWKEIRKKQKETEEVEMQLAKRESELNQKDAELEACKKRKQNQKENLQEEEVNPIKVEPLVEPEPIEKSEYKGGSGKIPGSSSSITERLLQMTDPVKIMREASDWMMKKIYQVQNPQDCDNAKYHYCPIVNSCGGGCVIHQLTYCMLVGFASNRVTVVADGFRYLRDCPGGNSPWSCVFEPVTRCNTDGITGGTPWSEEAEQRGEKITRVDLFSRSSMTRNFYPWAASDGFHTNTPFWLPNELAPILRTLHGDPRVWVIGHLEQYMLRFNNKTLHAIRDLNKNLVAEWKHPIAGVHVRRTDHRVEAPFRELSEYMEHVSKWFASIGQTRNKYVYLASDEPRVITEAEENYKDYKFLYHKQKNAISGAVNGNSNLQSDRSSMAGTMALLSDWYFLQQVDFLVGTSSSQVTRMAYELMQPFHANASALFVSLDDPWYFP